MSDSRVDLLLLDVDRTLITGTLAEGDSLELNSGTLALAEMANARGATVVLFSNHPAAADLDGLLASEPSLRRSVSGAVALHGPKVLAVPSFLSRLGVPHAATYLLDDDLVNIAEFKRIGIRASADPAVVRGVLEKQPLATEAHRQSRNDVRRIALALYSAGLEPQTVASTVAYLRQRAFAVDVGHWRPEELPRIVELFARTNQLHFNPALFASRDQTQLESELRAMAARGSSILVARIALGGHHLGVQAAAIVDGDASGKQILNACLSCSVLPFAVVEPLFVKAVVSLAGVLPVVAVLSDTAYNRRVREVLAACGGQWAPNGNLAFHSVPVLTDDEAGFCRALPETLVPEDGVPAVAAFFDRHVLPRIQDAPGSRILDLGHGYGEALGDRRQRALDVLSRELGIEVLRTDFAPRAPTVTQMDAQALTSVATGSRDFVFALELLEHVDRPADVLSEASRVLRPGGGCPERC